MRAHCRGIGRSSRDEGHVELRRHVGDWGRCTISPQTFASTPRDMAWISAPTLCPRRPPDRLPTRVRRWRMRAHCRGIGRSSRDEGHVELRRHVGDSMSATTTGSPPDFASPMYSNAGQGESTPVANMAHVELRRHVGDWGRFALAGIAVHGTGEVGRRSGGRSRVLCLLSTRQRLPHSTTPRQVSTHPFHSQCTIRWRLWPRAAGMLKPKWLLSWYRFM
jgi:hypothetical protein